jgi:hypothetical protein
MLFPKQANEGAELTIRDPVKSQIKERRKDDVKLSKFGRIKSSLELSMNRLTGKRHNCQFWIYICLNKRMRLK